MRLPAQLVVLGHGETRYEQKFSALARSYPGHISVTLSFDRPLAHLIEAGADMFPDALAFRTLRYESDVPASTLRHGAGGACDRRSRRLGRKFSPAAGTERASSVQ